MIDMKRIDSVEVTTANLYKIWNLVVEENSLLKPNHVGFRCDGAAAMIGRKNSLSVHVQTKCPATIVIHCYAHRLALACSDSAIGLENIKNLEIALVQLWTFLAISPKKIAKVQKFQNSKGKN